MLMNNLVSFNFVASRDLLRISDFFFEFTALLPLSGFFTFLVIRSDVGLLAGNPITLLGPATEVNEPAAIGTKRPVRIIFPDGFLATSGTFHLARHDVCPMCLMCWERKVPPHLAFSLTALDP